jgi:hypothetical protein
MKRIHLFELADQSWCPFVIRRGVTEYLAAATRLTKLYRPTTEVLTALMNRTSEKTLLVIGAGSGGGILDIFADLPSNTNVILTDLLPDSEFRSDNARIQYRQESVDAFNLPKDLPGIWIMYTAFHHFPPSAAKKILASAVATKRPIAVFEGAPRSAVGVFMTFFIPPIVLLLTPFVRPFRWSRLILTYLIPIFPLVFFWDGLISNLRTYNIDELKEMAAEFPNYQWDICELQGSALGIPSIVGWPRI